MQLDKFHSVCCSVAECMVSFIIQAACGGCLGKEKACENAVSGFLLGSSNNNNVTCNALQVSFLVLSN